jgi:hypothetical protein
MAQEYTMVEAGLSPATSPEFRAAFKRAKRLFDASQRRPSFNQGAAIVVSEDVEPGMPERPIPCIYPEKMPRAYGPSTGFDVERDYAHLYDIAWTTATRDTLVIVYRGADGGEGTVRMKMPMPEDHNAVAPFNEMKSDYLRKLTGGSGPVDTRTVVDALREMDAKVPKGAKVAKAPKVAPVPVPEPEPVPQLTRDDTARSRVVYLESVVAELRDEVFRLTAELNDARECADTDAADAMRARETVAELRAEINGLRYLRPKVEAPPVVLFNPIVRA